MNAVNVSISVSKQSNKDCYTELNVDILRFYFKNVFSF